eukprot:319568_1
MLSQLLPLLFVVVLIINAQDEPTIDPCSGRDDDSGCSSHTTPSPNATSFFTSPQSTDADHGRNWNDTYPPTHDLNYSYPTQAPHEHDDGRINETTHPFPAPTTNPVSPTYNHDHDTNFPSVEPTPYPTLSPSRPPTDENETYAPTHEPTLYPTTFAPTTAFPSLPPTSDTPTTSSPTKTPTTKSPTQDGAIMTTMTESESPPINQPNDSAMNNAFSDLTEIIVLVLGIVFGAAICGIIYYLFQRKRTHKQA